MYLFQLIQYYSCPREIFVVKTAKARSADRTKVASRAGQAEQGHKKNKNKLGSRNVWTIGMYSSIVHIRPRLRFGLIVVFVFVFAFVIAAVAGRFAHHLQPTPSAGAAVGKSGGRGWRWSPRLLAAARRNTSSGGGGRRRRRRDASPSFGCGGGGSSRFLRIRNSAVAEQKICILVAFAVCGEIEPRTNGNNTWKSAYFQVELDVGRPKEHGRKRISIFLPHPQFENIENYGDCLIG